MSTNQPYTPYTPTHPSTSTPTGFQPHTPGFNTPTPSARGRGAGGAKRGRKPRGGAVGVGVGATMGSSSASSTTFSGGTSTGAAVTSQAAYVHWAAAYGQRQTGGYSVAAGASSATAVTTTTTAAAVTAGAQTTATTSAALNLGNYAMPSSSSLASGSGTGTIPTLDTTGLISLAGPSTSGPVLPLGSSGVGAAGGVGTLGGGGGGSVGGVQRPHGADDEGEGEDEMLPAMADDDYSAQLSWQSQSKDNLKVLMDNFSPAQYDRFEAYRRHALPKQAVRKVIQQTLGQQVSQPVAQIVAGFAKVFVGEIVEKARAVQTRRGETGPLSPDHLREAYRMYQEETGRVGAARPLRAKKLFVR